MTSSVKQLTLDKKNGDAELADAHDKIAQLQQDIENATAELQDTCKSVNLCSFVCSSCICLFFSPLHLKEWRSSAKKEKNSRWLEWKTCYVCLGNTFSGLVLFAKFNDACR